jgi:hypothetical protein
VGVLLVVLLMWREPLLFPDFRARMVAARAVRAHLEPLACKFRERPEVGTAEDAAARIGAALIAAEVGSSGHNAEMSRDESKLVAMACIYETDDGNQPVWRTVSGTVEAMESGIIVAYDWEAWVTPTRRDVQKVARRDLRRLAFAPPPHDRSLERQIRARERRIIADLVRGWGWDCPYVRVEPPVPDADERGR